MTESIHLRIYSHTDLGKTGKMGENLLRETVNRPFFKLCNDFSLENWLYFWAFCRNKSKSRAVKKENALLVSTVFSRFGWNILVLNNLWGTAGNWKMRIDVLFSISFWIQPLIKFPHIHCKPIGAVQLLFPSENSSVLDSETSNFFLIFSNAESWFQFFWPYMDHTPVTMGICFFNQHALFP